MTPWSTGKGSLVSRDCAIGSLVLLLHSIDPSFCTSSILQKAKRQTHMVADVVVMFHLAAQHDGAGLKAAVRVVREARRRLVRRHFQLVLHMRVSTATSEESSHSSAHPVGISKARSRLVHQALQLVLWEVQFILECGVLRRVLLRTSRPSWLTTLRPSKHGHGQEQQSSVEAHQHEEGVQIAQGLRIDDKDRLS